MGERHVLLSPWIQSGLTRRDAPGRSGPCRRLRAASAGWYTTIARSSFTAGAATPMAAAGGATSLLIGKCPTTKGCGVTGSTSGTPTADSTGGTSASCASNGNTNARVSDLAVLQNRERERERGREGERAGGSYESADFGGGYRDPVDVEPRLRRLLALPLQQRRGVHGRRCPHVAAHRRRLHPESMLRLWQHARAGPDRRHLRVLHNPKPKRTPVNSSPIRRNLRTKEGERARCVRVAGSWLRGRGPRRAATPRAPPRPSASAPARRPWPTPVPPRAAGRCAPPALASGSVSGNRAAAHSRIAMRESESLRAELESELECSSGGAGN